MYSYETEKATIFTPEGTKRLLRVRDRIQTALLQCGAFRLQELGIVSWEEMACVDFMIEEKEIVELQRDCWAQYRVFTTPQVHNR